MNDKAPTPQQLADALISVLDVEPVEQDFFRGIATPGGRGRSFGGQVIAQALMAATRTVDEDRPAHSLHAYFMRPGDATKPVLYQVTRDRDGRSFATRRVVAIQHGKNTAAQMRRPVQPRSAKGHRFCVFHATPVRSLRMCHASDNLANLPIPRCFRGVAGWLTSREDGSRKFRLASLGIHGSIRA